MSGVGWPQKKSDFEVFKKILKKSCFVQIKKILNRWSLDDA